MLSAQCALCKHYREATLNCDAFPGEGGIPEVILGGEFDHRHSFPGDNGIHWEPTAKGKKVLDESKQEAAS